MRPRLQRLVMETTPTESGVRISKFALHHAVSMNLLFVVLVVVGALVVTDMPVDVWPDVSLDEATVETLWLGASAEDIERLVTDRIEEKIEDIRGVDRIISDSKADASLIRVKFRENLSELELDAAFRQLRAAVDRVTDLPEDAEKPVVTKMSIGEVFFLLWVAISDVGDVGEEVLHDIAFRLKPVLGEIPGVAKVDDQLIRDREIHIKADQDEMRKHGLTLQDLGDLLSQYNRNLPSGTLQQPDREISIRAEGGVASPEQLGAIVVYKNPMGGHVYLRDVATITTGFARKTFFARHNLRDCLAIGITKTREADTRLVAQRVREVLADYQATLPSGVEVQVVDDTSHIIGSRLHVLSTNLAGGVVLVFIVLWVAVGLRNSLLAIVGIPFSFCCALICMNALGVTINAISLIGLVLCSGMIVDDAIVVLENIYRLVEERGITKGDFAGLRAAIVEGVGEVFWPVVSSSATTVAAFLPLLIMVGVLGSFLSTIPKTVAVVLLASLFECLLILPVHYWDFGGRVHAKRKARTPTGCAAYQGWGHRAYDRLLTVILSCRYLVLLPVGAVAFLAASAAPLVDVELFPSDLQRCLVDIQVADEASLDQTGELVRPIEALVLSLTDQVSGVLTSYGVMVTEDNAVKMRNNLAQMHVELASTSQVGADSTVVAAVLREKIVAYLTAHPDCGVRSARVWAPRSGPPVGKPVSIRIECPEFPTAKLLADRYKARLAAMEGVYGIKDDLEFGRQQINLLIHEDRASIHGLTFLALASVLRTANEGRVVSAYKDTRSGEDLDVLLTLDERFRRNLDDLLQVDIRSPAGHVVQMGEIADLTVTQGYAGIPHHNGKRVVTVTAEIDTNKQTSKAVNERIQAAFARDLRSMPQVRVTYGGQFAETSASFSSLRRAYLVALVLIFLLLATQFRSYIQPVVVLSTVPFAWVGVVGGLIFSGYPFTVMTFIAIVGMSGVVVNDSILLVDCANRKRRNEPDLVRAVRAACVERLRPVILTTITTVLGLAPLALGLGGRSRIWSPFASSFAWGLAFSTLVTLLLVPAVYCITQDVAGLFRRRSLDDQLGDDQADIPVV